MMQRSVGLLTILLLCAFASPALAFGWNWAIAIGENTNPIVSRNHPAPQPARKQALEGCGVPSCRIVAEGQNCAALATDRKIWGIAKGSSKPKAGKAALAQCDAAGGRQCKVVHTFCGSEH